MKKSFTTIKELRNKYPSSFRNLNKEVLSLFVPPKDGTRKGNDLFSFLEIYKKRTEIKSFLSLLRERKDLIKVIKNIDSEATITTPDGIELYSLSMYIFIRDNVTPTKETLESDIVCLKYTLSLLSKKRERVFEFLKTIK